MDKEFIILKEFDKQWHAMGLFDDDLRRLEFEILHHPELGVVIPGTGGLLKRRFAFEGSGKSGSARVCYVDFIYAEKVLLITAYPKNAISSAQHVIAILPTTKYSLGNFLGWNACPTYDTVLPSYLPGLSIISKYQIP